MSEKILKEYTNYSNPGSFSGITGFIKNNKKLKNVKKVLLNEEAYTLHRPIRKKFPRSKVVVGEIDEQWQVDLVDVKKLKYQNSHNQYILTCIDVLSKYAWAEPIKNKTAEETKKAFEKILSQGRKPKYIYLDAGKEFMGVCKKYLDKNGIKLLATNSIHKASIVERFNRTLKEKMWRVFTFNKNNKYINILQQLVTSYNNSYHRSIKAIPAKVNKSNEKEILTKLYGDQDTRIKFKFKIGDYVRISIEKKIFEKGYTPNWSKEIYVITALLPYNPPKYLIKALDGENFAYKFYDQELQKVSFKEFPYDTYNILKQDKNKVLIHQLNSENKESKWVDKNFLKE